MAAYDGPVVFREGVHYPADPEHEDGADLSRPLRWEDGGYRDAAEGEASHNETYQANDVIVHPEHITAPVPGEATYPVGVHVVSYDAVTYYLVDDQNVVHTDHPLVWDSDAQLFRAAS